MRLAIFLHLKAFRRYVCVSCKLISGFLSKWLERCIFNAISGNCEIKYASRKSFCEEKCKYLDKLSKATQCCVFAGELFVDSASFGSLEIKK